VIITMVLVSASAAAWAAGAAEKITAIVGATVLHPELEGAAVVAPRSTIVIKGNRIIAVGPAANTRVPRGAGVIDAHGKWVISGLIDSHVHFFQSGNLYTRPDVVDLNSLVPYSEEVRRNRARLPQTFKSVFGERRHERGGCGRPVLEF
jgi:imidazolonepropionase-like amidohydrolase